MPELSYREAVRDALSQAMRRDEDVFVMGEDIAEMGGSMGVTQGMLDEFGPERVRNTPISEIGVLRTRCGPNSSTIPWVTPIDPPISAMSSPITKTSSSRRIACVSASRTASR